MHVNGQGGERRAAARRKRLPDGRVTDYVVLSAGSLRTGVFNLADAAILTGAILWLGSGITRRRDDPSSDA